MCKEEIYINMNISFLVSEFLIFVCGIHSSYKEAVLKAVNLGDDTDTVAAVTGGLAGLYYTYDKIPASWRAKVQKKDWIDSLLKA